MSEGTTGDDARVGTGWAPTRGGERRAAPGGRQRPPAAPAGPTRRSRRPEHSASDTSASRLWWWIGGAAGVALAVVVGLVTNQNPPPPAPDPEIVVLPVPTATVDPIDRGDSTELVAAMPGTVLEFALADVAEDESLLEAGAVEAWRLAYDDGSGREVVVHVGQWADPEGATSAMADLLADAEPAPTTSPGSDGGTSPEPPEGAAAPGAQEPGSDVASAGDDEAGADDPASPDDADTGPRPLPASGAVEVDGEQVGEYRILAADAVGEQAVAIWTNGTVLFRAEGPAEAFPNFYAAFPL